MFKLLKSILAIALLIGVVFLGLQIYKTSGVGGKVITDTKENLSSKYHEFKNEALKKKAAAEAVIDAPKNKVPQQSAENTVVYVDFRCSRLCRKSTGHVQRYYGQDRS